MQLHCSGQLDTSYNLSMMQLMHATPACRGCYQFANREHARQLELPGPEELSA